MAKKSKPTLEAMVLGIGALVSSCSADAVSSQRGNISACKRLRKKIREMRDNINTLSKELSQQQAETKRTYAKAHRGWGNKKNRVMKEVTNKNK